MIGIVIAAGMGRRMGSLTNGRPKCMLPIAGRPLIDHTLRLLRDHGCTRLLVITGYRAEAIDIGDTQRVYNADFANNNILHSLMTAREFLDDDCVVSYSDIWVEPEIYRHLMATPGDIVLSADRDWLPYYEGRRYHPVSEAEKIFVGPDRRVVRIGKHLSAQAPKPMICTEFLGLWRMSRAGAATFLSVFLDVDRHHKPDSPFKNTAKWRQAYVTDLVQELVDRGTAVDCSLIERGWAELDTEEDFLRLPSIAARQRLRTLTHGEAS